MSQVLVVEVQNSNTDRIFSLHGLKKSNRSIDTPNNNRRYSLRFIGRACSCSWNTNDESSIHCLMRRALLRRSSFVVSVVPLSDEGQLLFSSSPMERTPVKWTHPDALPLSAGIRQRFSLVISAMTHLVSDRMVENLRLRRTYCFDLNRFESLVHLMNYSSKERSCEYGWGDERLSGSCALWKLWGGRHWGRCSNGTRRYQRKDLNTLSCGVTHRFFFTILQSTYKQICETHTEYMGRSSQPIQIRRKYRRSVLDWRDRSIW